MQTFVFFLVLPYPCLLDPPRLFFLFICFLLSFFSFPNQNPPCDYFFCFPDHSFVRSMSIVTPFVLHPSFILFLLLCVIFFPLVARPLVLCLFPLKSPVPQACAPLPPLVSPHLQLLVCLYPLFDVRKCFLTVSVLVSYLFLFLCQIVLAKSALLCFFFRGEAVFLS